MLKPAEIPAGQKRQDMLAAFWPRKVSPYVTRVLMRTPLSANQTTVLWGAISVLNSYTVYLALTGSWLAIVLVPLIYEFAFVLDCVDGEIARLKNQVNPIGGKLLDGVCHRATEFSLLCVFAVAAYVTSQRLEAFVVGLLMIAADGMYVYVYERRLTALRVQGYKGHIRHSSSADVYQSGQTWAELTRHQRLGTVTGLFHYKSTYAVIALSYLPPVWFVAGLGAIAAYKHWKWIALVRRTLGQGAAMAAAPNDEHDAVPLAARPSGEERAG